MNEQLWIDCTLAEAVEAGIEKCQYFASGNWNNHGGSLSVSIAVTRQWRRPETEADRASKTDCAGREVDLTASDTGDDWRELNGLRIDDDGRILIEGIIIASANPKWVSAVCDHFTSLSFDNINELLDRWQSRRKPRMPTVKTPEGCEWRHNNRRLELVDGIMHYLVPTNNRERAALVACVSAFDELHGVETVELDAIIFDQGGQQFVKIPQCASVETGRLYRVTMTRIEREAK